MTNPADISEALGLLAAADAACLPLRQAAPFTT
jgi:hypothetical protein